MKILCSQCGQTAVIPQKQPYHAGFSNRGFLYCDSFPAILEFDAFSPKYVSTVGDKHPWSLNPKEKRQVEDALKPYRKGGRFRFSAFPRCPSCNQPIRDLLRDDIHFVELGEVVDGDKDEAWL